MKVKKTLNSKSSFLDAQKVHKTHFNIKRGILISLALYGVTFIIGVILTIISKVSLDSPQNIPTTYWIITIIATVILTSLASLWYFSKANRNAKEGLKLGITFVIVGFILDLLFFLPLFFSGSGAQIILQYYSTPSFYTTLALVVATAVFIGSRGHITKAKEEKVSIKKKRK